MKKLTIPMNNGRKTLDLICPKHVLGELAQSGPDHRPPSNGLLTLATYLEEEEHSIECRIWDENVSATHAIPMDFNADIVGVTVWFSNYQRGLEILRIYKDSNPKATTIIGGPNVNGIEARILINNPFVDYVCSGEGEYALVGLTKGLPERRIPGLCYRSGGTICRVPPRQVASLDDIPPITLEHLKTPYRWRPNCSNTSAFPLSGIRGCLRVNRCDYCSIATYSVRKKSPKRYWHEMQALARNYGIMRFFETGDIFDSKYAKALADTRPMEGPYPNLRIYSYPGLIRMENIQNLVRIGVDNVFIGIESVLVWRGDQTRRMARSYGICSVMEEINLLWDHGITTMPSFILGMPGEDSETLKQNLDLIERVAGHPGVNEMHVNAPFPLPNSRYFEMCMVNDRIFYKYRDRTGIDLQLTDDIDYILLSELFVEEYSDVKYDLVRDSIQTLRVRFNYRMANWGTFPKQPKRNDK